MKINNLYVGGWFQRTMLQLTEIYDFVRGDKSKLKLNQNRLDNLRDALHIASVEYNVSGQEYVKVDTSDGFTIKVFEDGLITLNKPTSSIENLFVDLNTLTEYYETKLAAAINYLFSLGAPVPKDLTNIENVYPYFVVCEDSSLDEMRELLEKTDKQKFFEFTCDKYSVVRGEKYYFVNNRKSTQPIIERYIEEQIFIREFKDQLHKYLNIHRNIWEKIDSIKAKKSVKGSDIVKITTKLDNYSQTITLIEGRIDQMSTYIDTRATIAKNDPGLKEFLAMSGYRYDTLKNTLDYIKSLWTMTKNHLTTIQRTYNSLQNKVTNRSVKSLTIVSTMNAAAAVLGLLLKSDAKFTWFGLTYFLFVVLLCIGSVHFLKKLADKSTYLLSDADNDN
jgi:hypothetical protein